jgi:hypothetical protein
MLNRISYFLIFFYFSNNSITFAFLNQIKPLSNHRDLIYLNAKIASKPTNEEDQKAITPRDNEMVTVPFNGLLGSDASTLFDKPIEIFDPTKESDNLPGEDGSDEKIEAIMNQIQKRVEDLKSKGTWGEEIEEYGKDPLANISVWNTMMMQLKACKPFESVGELALTFTLLILTTVSLTLYILGMREAFDNFITWYLDTDFDFISSIIRNN